MYFPDRGCVHTLLTLCVYATACVVRCVAQTNHDHRRNAGLKRRFGIISQRPLSFRLKCSLIGLTVIGLHYLTVYCQV